MRFDFPVREAAHGLSPSFQEEGSQVSEDVLVQGYTANQVSGEDWTQIQFYSFTIFAPLLCVIKLIPN